MPKLTPNEHCSHEDTQLVCRIIGGNDHFGAQCLRCGKFEPIKKATLSIHEINCAQPYDSELAGKFSENISAKWRAQHDAKQREESAKWWAEYNAYLRTEKWKDKSRRVLERDRHICQACLKRKATQAHHKTYKRVYDEPLFDLIAVCEICHDAIHKKVSFTE